MNGNRTIRLACAALLMLLCGRLPASLADAPPKVVGGYTVVARGYWSGSGNAAVGAQSVTITLQITDPNGNRGMLIAPALKLVNGRFSGDGTAMGQPVTLSGRVDGPDEAIKVARITCTYGDGGQRNGRIVGDRRN